MDLIEKAVEDYTRVIDITREKDATSERFNALYNRGNWYRILGELELSIDDLYEAVRTNQTDPHAKNNLGLSYLDNMEYNKALEEFKNAIEIQADSSTLYNNRGLV